MVYFVSNPSRLAVNEAAVSMSLSCNTFHLKSGYMYKNINFTIKLDIVLLFHVCNSMNS